MRLFYYKKVIHPVRTTRRAAVRAVTPKPVRQVRRTATAVRHPGSSLEGAAKASVSRSVSRGGKRRGSSSSGGVGWFGVLVLLAVAIGLAIKYWYVVALMVVVVLVYLLATASRREKKRRLEHEAWLAAPPPPLLLPGRFTQKWIVANVPRLHPGQTHAMIDAMRARGWSQDEIERRVEPYLPEHR